MEKWKAYARGLRSALRDGTKVNGENKREFWRQRQELSRQFAPFGKLGNCKKQKWLVRRRITTGLVHFQTGKPKELLVKRGHCFKCNESGLGDHCVDHVQFGNAASRHWSGHEAEKAVTCARARVAPFVGASPAEIIWTSGATEANNLAIRGVAASAARAGFGKHIITQATEHKAVLDPMERLRANGFEVTVLPVDHDGRVSPEKLGEAVLPDTALVSFMWENNENGTIQDMDALVTAARAVRPEVVFHSDATRSCGQVARRSRERWGRSNEFYGT